MTHFNQQPNGKIGSCYMRLWELEEGDEDGQNFFAGGRGGQQAPRNEQEIAEIALEEAIVGDEGVGNHQQPEPRPALNENGRRVDVEREGPLVLRIDAGAARLQAPAEDANQLQLRNSAAAGRTAAEAILHEAGDSKQLTRDEGVEQGVSVRGRIRFKDRTITLFDATDTSTRSTCATKPTRRSRPERQPGSDTSSSSRSTTTRT
ncbi:hypothetical protein SLS64_005286 [Diaporthe eres]